MSDCGGDYVCTNEDGHIQAPEEPVVIVQGRAPNDLRVIVNGRDLPVMGYAIVVTMEGATTTLTLPGDATVLCQRA